MPSTFGNEPIRSIADVTPGLAEGSGAFGSKLAIQRHVVVPLGPPLLADGATYKQVVFVAPCDGCFIKEAWISAAVAIVGGTNTLAFANYDASTNTSRNMLSVTSVDPTSVTAQEGTKLPLASTWTNLVMDEGDTIVSTLACGTMSTDGEGYAVHLIVLVPEIV